MTLEAVENKYVAFIDILGFAALTEANELDIKGIKETERPFSGDIGFWLIGNKNPLTRTFAKFHSSLKWAIDMAEMRHPLTAITFSDSAFIATKYASQCITIVMDLMTTLMWQEVPIRVGVGFGNFAALRFRSDISSDGGDHASHFLGTSVVRACKTESCGIKGMRILLHPTVAEQFLQRKTPLEVSGKSKIELLKCTDLEINNSMGVEYEINYWKTRATDDKRTWDGFQKMWKSAPEDKQDHYLSTVAAIDRMRIAQNMPPIENYKRVTLKRK